MASVRLSHDLRNRIQRAAKTAYNKATVEPSMDTATIELIWRGIVANTVGKTCLSGRAAAELTRLRRRSWMTRCLKPPPGFSLLMQPRGAGAVRPKRCSIAARSG